MIDKEEAKVIYNRAHNLWGMKCQYKVAAEECAELIQALLKMDRGFNSSTHDEVLEEIADVTIMIEQLHLMFNHQKIEKFRQKKLERLKKFIDAGEHKRGI